MNGSIFVARYYTQFLKLAELKAFNEKLARENFENSMNGLEAVWPEKRSENGARDCDCASCQNPAEPLWSFAARALGAEKAVHSGGKILIHAI
jgi:hypothetical protein